MGSSCCHAESPCGSAEERSVLLKNDSKTTTATGDTTVVGTCGPEGDDEMRKTPDDNNIKVEVKAEEVKVKAVEVKVKAEAVEVKAVEVKVKAEAVEVKAVEVKVKAEAVQVKQSPEVGDSEPNNTQENRALQEVVKQKATPSPRKGSEPEENSSRAQDEDAKNRPAGSEEAELLQCTLNSPQKAAADWQVFKATNAAPKEENPASTQDKIPDIASLTAETVCPENHTEINTTSEHITLANAHDNDEEAGSEVTADSTVAEPSGEFPQNNEALSAPNTAACQVSSISVVSQEIDKESPSCAVTEHSENGSSSVCDEAGPEVIKSHDVSESSPGSEPSGLNHSGEERSAANFVGEPETTAPSDASESSKSNQDAKPDLECATMSWKEVTSSESIIGEKRKDHDKDGDVPVAKEDEEIKEEVENTPAEAETEAGNAEIPELTGKEELSGSTSTGVTADEISVTENEDSAEDGLGNSEEDLYRGAEELSASQTNKPGTHLKVEDRCSLAPAVDILSYSEREWKGNTAKSALIRKGYEEMSQRFGSLRRVRGDNYCALRATLFQVLSHSTQLPSWLQEEDVIMLPEQLEAQKGLISQWTFPGECLQGDGTGDATLQLKGYMELLRNKWQAAVDCPSAVERQQLCEQVFQGGEEELGLLEALKLLMLGRAAELHGCMQTGEDVPLFCWLLFARDTSDCPRSFLSNHLSHVGLSAGLEQVEMFLLGYALQCTIQVYRLYKADTEEFVTYYPDDHKDDWPSVCLVTEDDRHYNVPVVDAAEHEELDSS